MGASGDPRQSSEYKALDATLSTPVHDRDNAITGRGVAESRSTGAEGKVAAAQAASSAAVAAAEVREAASDAKDVSLAQKEASLVTREGAVAGAEAQVAANTVTDGVWTIGVDIEPGAYRVTSPVTEMCYWAILATGSNGNIIENDVVTGGSPSVTLRAGQDFKSTRCGSWVKQ